MHLRPSLASLFVLFLFSFISPAHASDPFSGFMLANAMVSPTGMGFYQQLQYAQALSRACNDSMLQGRYIWLPDEVAALFGNSEINLQFNSFWGSPIQVWGRVQGGKIGGLHCGASGRADYDVSMGVSEALSLATSDKPVQAFLLMEREGRISVVARGGANAQKLAAARAQAAGNTQAVPQSMQDYFGTVRRMMGWG
ncbi:Uncharacterised protein [uncultured archaeon]|nr:Uncharacterised protein [uncultured archaeon]